MKTITINIDDLIFEDTKKISQKIKKPRNININEALYYYNQIKKRILLEKTLKKESCLVKDDSIHVLKEYEDC